MYAFLRIKMLTNKPIKTIINAPIVKKILFVYLPTHLHNLYL